MATNMKENGFEALIVRYLVDNTQCLLNQQTLSNVFMIGKMGFSILTDSDLNFEHYPLSLESFHVLEKATNPNRCERYASITEFKKHWLKAL